MVDIVKRLDASLDRYRSDTPQLTPLVGKDAKKLMEERSVRVRDMDLEFTKRNRSKSSRSVSSASLPPPSEFGGSVEEIEDSEAVESEEEEVIEPRKSARNKGKGKGKAKAA